MSGGNAQVTSDTYWAGLLHSGQSVSKKPSRRKEARESPGGKLCHLRLNRRECSLENNVEKQNRKRGALTSLGVKVEGVKKQMADGQSRKRTLREIDRKVGSQDGKGSCAQRKGGVKASKRTHECVIVGKKPSVKWRDQRSTGEMRTETF